MVVHMTDNNGDLTFSSEAAATRSILYHGLNDINLYVEDADRQYEYETIFKRLLGEEYCIRTIFPLGGKINVKARYEEFGATYDGVRNFYIVDGDFDRYIHRADMITDDCFIYLKTYNIENYYIDEQACLLFAKGLLMQTDEDVKQKIDFPSWKTQIVSEAKKLFLCYCFVQSIHADEKTLSRSHYEFLDAQTGFQKTDGSVNQYYNHVMELSENANAQIQEIATAYERENGQDYFNLICGKFLITSLTCYLKKKANKTLQKDQLKWFLTTHFDVTKLSYVKDRILSLATPL